MTQSLCGFSFYHNKIHLVLLSYLKSFYLGGSCWLKWLKTCWVRKGSIFSTSIQAGGGTVPLDDFQRLLAGLPFKPYNFWAPGVPSTTMYTCTPCSSPHPGLADLSGVAVHRDGDGQTPGALLLVLLTPSSSPSSTQDTTSMTPSWDIQPKPCSSQWTMSNRSNRSALRVAGAHRWKSGTAGGGRTWGKFAACARTPRQPPLSATPPEQALHARKVPHLLPCVLEGDPARLAFGRAPPDQWPCGWPLPHPSHLVGIMPGFFTKLVSPNSLQGGLQSYTEPSKEATATTKSRRSGWRPGAPGSSAPDAAAHRAP